MNVVKFHSKEGIILAKSKEDLSRGDFIQHS